MARLRIRSCALVDGETISAASRTSLAAKATTSTPGQLVITRSGTSSRCASKRTFTPGSSSVPSGSLDAKAIWRFRRSRWCSNPGHGLTSSTPSTSSIRCSRVCSSGRARTSSTVQPSGRGGMKNALWINTRGVCGPPPTVLDQVRASHGCDTPSARRGQLSRTAVQPDLELDVVLVLAQPLDLRRHPGLVLAQDVDPLFARRLAGTQQLHEPQHLRHRHARVAQAAQQLQELDVLVGERAPPAGGAADVVQQAD